MSRRRGCQAVLLALVLVVVGLLLAGCMQERSHRMVVLSDREGANRGGVVQDPRDPPLRVAVAAMLSPEETLRRYDPLLTYLSQKLARPVVLEQRQTYAEINDMVRTTEAQLAFVDAGAYVVGHREFGMELLAAPQVRGAATAYAYLIVPQDSAAHSLADLRGGRFAFSDPLSSSGRILPAYLLQRMDERPETFFRQTIFTYGQDRSLEAVSEELVDGASVGSTAYEYVVAHNPLFSTSVRVIYSSPPLGAPPVVVPPGLDVELKGRLRQILLAMSEDPRGKEILRDLRIERFDAAEDRAYAREREMADRVRGMP